MTTPLVLDVADPELLVGVVEADGVRVGPAPPSLAAALDALVAARAGEGFPPPDVKSAIRDLLRRGGYKPTGRGKPASEYLAQAAARGEFPRISNVVDVCNLVSLDSGLPISLLDRDRAMDGTSGLVIRRGREGESHVFNAAGHVIDVAGLLCVARDGGAPLGNAVKDSMATKTTDATRAVLGVVYASRRITSPDALALVLGRFARMLVEHAGATATRTRVLVPS